MIAVALAVAAALAPAASAVTASSCSPDAAWGTNRPDLANEVVQRVNAYRAGKGLAALSVSSSLRSSSEWKSSHMAGHGYFSHDDPAPPIARSAFTRAKDCGFSGSTWGENIAYGYGSAQAVMDGWIGSSGHRANLENPAFTTIGVGVAQSGSGTLYWTQNFGNDAPAAAPPPAPQPAPTPPPTPPPSTSAPVASPTQGTGKTPPTAPRSPPATAPPPPSDPVTATPPPPTPAVRRAAVGALPTRTNEPRAGGRLVASVPFVRLDAGSRLTRGDVRCRAELDGRRLRVVVNAFRGGAATCEWLVPRGAVGERIVGVVAVQLGSSAALRRFERTVGRRG